MRRRVARLGAEQVRETIKGAAVLVGLVAYGFGWLYLLAWWASC